MPTQRSRGQHHWSAPKLALAGLGVIAIVLGIVLYSIAHPSPHFYIELFFALPLMWLGSGMLALGIVLQGKPFPLVIRVVGWALLALVIGVGIAWVVSWYRISD